MRLGGGGFVRAELGIMRQHLLPSTCANIGFSEKDILFENEDVIRELIQRVQAEDGVRNMKRAIETILAKVNVLRLTGGVVGGEPLPYSVPVAFPMTITSSLIRKCLPPLSEKDAPPSMMYC